MLDHERLDVYQCSIQFLAIAFAMLGRLPRGYAPLADQLHRAATSIPLNIAEAAGKTEQDVPVIPDSEHEDEYVDEDGHEYEHAHPHAHVDAHALGLIGSVLNPARPRYCELLGSVLGATARR